MKDFFENTFRSLNRFLLRLALLAVILSVFFLAVLYFHSGDLPVPPDSPGTDGGGDLNPDGGTDNPVSPLPDEQVDPALLFEVYSPSLYDQGYLITDGVYLPEEERAPGTDYKLVKVNTSTFLPTGYSYSTRTIPVTYRTQPQNNHEETVAVPAVHPRMGFLFLTCDDGKRLLLDYLGGVIVENLLDNLQLSGTRDKEGRPLFLESGSYYYFDYASRSFVPTASPSSPDPVFYRFDYPSYYAAATEGISLSYNGKSWGYQQEGGKNVVTYSFSGGFPFREGYGAMYDSKGKVTLYSADGKQRFYQYAYYLPERNDIMSLGYYVFNHGLMRVRNITKTADRELILMTNGKLMSLPADYTVISYSDGVFLLEKNGRYGYLSHQGKWIAQPVYTYARPFLEGLAVVGYSDGKKGILDTGGNLVVPLRFDEITDCSGGVIALYDKDYGWTIVNKLKRENPPAS